MYFILTADTEPQKPKFGLGTLAVFKIDTLLSSKIQVTR